MFLWNWVNISHSGGFKLVAVYVLVKVKVGQASSVLSHVEKVKNVQHANMVTGPYDIIVYADIPEKAGFRKLVETIHESPGVERTETCMSI